MSQNESKMISEREAVLRERAAAARMRCAVAHELDLDEPSETPCERCEKRARELYPIKVTRPRIVADPHEYGCWKALDGFLLRADKPDDHEWVRCGNYGMSITAERVALWNDLLANPTEEVDADA